MASKIREKIIDEAICCFAKFGYAGCPTKFIAKTADVTEGSLFRLFASKEKLFDEALAKAKSRLLTAAEFAKLLDAGDIRSGLHRAVAALIKNWTADGARLYEFALLERGDETLKAFGPLYDSRVKAIAKAIRVGISRRQVRRDVDANAVAVVVYLTIKAIPLPGLSERRTKNAQLSLAEAFIDSVLVGILTKTSRLSQ